MKVYQYGLRPTTENATIVAEQMRLAHRYRNTLVEIERGRRAAIRCLCEAPVELAIFDAVQSRGDPETEKKQSAIVLIEARRRNIRTKKEGIARVNALALELHKSARAHCGVYWGTYLLVEDAMDASRKSDAKRGAEYWDGVTPNDPRFVRWTGDGAVQVQLQGGLSSGELWSNEDTRARMRHTGTSKGGRRDFAEIDMRVFSDENGKPIFARWPMVLHRPIPEDSTLKRISVHRRMRANHEEWSAEITLEMPAATHVPAVSGPVAFDIGWRVRDGGIRVAAWHDGANEGAELVLDERMLGGLRKASELGSVRDDNFNVACKSLSAWVDAGGAPAWIVERTKYMSRWTKPSPLARLVWDWKQQRQRDALEVVNRDEIGTMLFAELEAWRKQDRHLWQWEVHQRIGSLRARKDLYRNWAAQFADRYSTLVLEQFDLRVFAVLPAKGEKETPQEAHARANRHLVATSELRLCLVQAFQSRGREVKFMPAQNTTRTCSCCGLVSTFDAAKSVLRAEPCSGCGAQWDQDDNAAINLLGDFCERPGDASDTGTIRRGKKPAKVHGKGGRWGTAKKEKKERAGATEGTARELGVIAAE